jgi:hypothetical protein
MHELAHMEEPTDDIEHRIYHDTIRDIHADWLMTPCAELNDQIPRKVLLQERDRLSGDMDDREHHWRMLEQCPPGISPESHAFQFSGFNTNEIVMYYDYVREVAWSCWDGLRTVSDTEHATLETSRSELDTFLRDEVIRLRQIGEQWLDAPWDEDPTRTPRGIINLERRRQPNGGQFRPIDPDCPCCQALAAMSGIGFWSMDGCNMDDLFPFAYHHETIESWEQEQADYRTMSEQMDQERDLAKEWGLPSQYSTPPSKFGDIWRLIVKDETGEIPLGKRLNNVAHRVVSLVVQLRIAAKHDAGLVVGQHIELLPPAYASLRQACEESTERQLSRSVEPNVTGLLSFLNELTTHLERYLGKFETDEIEDDELDDDELDDDEIEDDDFEVDFNPEPPPGFRWRKE